MFICSFIELQHINRIFKLWSLSMLIAYSLAGTSKTVLTNGDLELLKFNLLGTRIFILKPIASMKGPCYMSS